MFKVSLLPPQIHTLKFIAPFYFLYPILAFKTPAPKDRMGNGTSTPGKVTYSTKNMNAPSRRFLPPAIDIHTKKIPDFLEKINQESEEIVASDSSSKDRRTVTVTKTASTSSCGTPSFTKARKAKVRIITPSKCLSESATKSNFKVFHDDDLEDKTKEAKMPSSEQLNKPSAIPKPRRARSSTRNTERSYVPKTSSMPPSTRLRSKRT